MNIGAAFTLIRNGASIKQTDSAGGIPITRIETIANRVIDRNHMGYADIYNGDKYSSYFLRDGDILMSHINSIQHLGKAAIYHPLDEKEKIIHGMNLLVLRANQKILDNQFAYFYFSSDSFLHKLPRITKKSVNQASFTVSELKKIDIPCPALSQQHKIAKILSIIQTLCNKRNEQLKILDELVKSRFIEMFGDPINNDKHWRSSLFKNQTVDIGDGLHGTPIYDDDGDYFFINGNNLDGKNIVITSSTKRVNKEMFNKYYIQLNSKTILLSINGTLGKTAIYNNEPIILGKSACYCTIGENLRRDFVLALFNTDGFRTFMNQNSTGTTIRNFGLKALRNFKIIVPPMIMQDQFISFKNQVDKSKMAVQKSLDELEILKKSLMQTYFG